MLTMKWCPHGLSWRVTRPRLASSFAGCAVSMTRTQSIQLAPRHQNFLGPSSPTLYLHVIISVLPTVPSKTLGVPRVRQPEKHKRHRLSQGGTGSNACATDRGTGSSDLGSHVPGYPTPEALPPCTNPGLRQWLTCLLVLGAGEISSYFQVDPEKLFFLGPA